MDKKDLGMEDIDKYNEAMQEETTKLDICGNTMTVKEMREAESEYYKKYNNDIKKLSVTNSNKIENANALVYYDDIIQYLNYGFIFYLRNVCKDELINDIKEKLKEIDLIKYMILKSKLFSFLKNDLKISENMIKYLIIMYKKIYLYLFRISPLSNIFSSLMKMSNKLDNIVFITRFELPEIQKLQFKDSFYDTSQQTFDVKSIGCDISFYSFEKYEIANIYEEFHKLDKNEKNKIIITNDSMYAINYHIENNTSNTTILTPLEDNNFTNEFLYLYYNILNKFDSDEDSEVNEVEIDKIDPYIEFYEEKPSFNNFLFI